MADTDSGLDELTPEMIAELGGSDLDNVSDEELEDAIDDLIAEGVVTRTVDPETGEEYISLSEEGRDLGLDGAMLQGDEGILDLFEGWLIHHYREDGDAETAFRKAAAEVRDDLETNIITLLERNDWELPSGTICDVRQMPAIHLEAARVEYEPEGES